MDFVLISFLVPYASPLPPFCACLQYLTALYHLYMISPPTQLTGAPDPQTCRDFRSAERIFLHFTIPCGNWSLESRKKNTYTTYTTVHIIFYFGV